MMNMSTINELLKKYNIEEELPEKFGELDEINLDEIEEYHTETHDGKTVHVFTDKVMENGHRWETILDLDDFRLVQIVKREDGSQVFGPYHEYKYAPEVDEIMISQG